jgi:Bacterial SH3 domain
MRLMAKLMTGAGVLALSTGFAAAAPAVVANDLNLRAGPGTEYPVVAAMPSGATVDVMGCEASWCRVAYNGTVGWASRAYMGLGGGVVAAPAYGGYGESYASYAPRAYGPGYGYDEDSYAYGGVSPGYTYGYSGTTGYRGSYGYSEGERALGNERRFSEQSAVRGERRVGEETTIRSERKSGERGAARAQGLNDDANARSSAPRASEIQGANPMLNPKDQPAAGASGNARAEARGSASQRRGAANASGGANARATTGAGGGEEDHGPNFIGPGKKNTDNH